MLSEHPVDRCGFKMDRYTGSLFKCLMRSILRDRAVRPLPVGWGGGRGGCAAGEAAKKEPLRAGRLLDIYRNSKGQKRNANLRRGMVRILTSWLMAL